MKRDLKSTEKVKEKEVNNSPSNENSNNLSKEKINKKGIKKTEDKIENVLINKISSYLRHITIHLNKDENYNFEKNKDNLCNILKYIADYKIRQDPIDFLKKTNLGKYVKYISDKIKNEEIKRNAEEAYDNLEKQVLNQLFGKK